MSVNNLLAEGLHPVVYQVRLPVSMRTLILVTSAIEARRVELGTRWRKAAAWEQAKLALAHLRHDQRLSDLAVANGVSVSTISRWVDEVVDLMARRAPRLDRVLATIAASGQEVVLLDGTLVRTRRRTGRANRPNYSSKHKCHGLLFLALTDTKGNLLWISMARPGGSSEVTAARRDKIVERLRRAGLAAIGDLGFAYVEDKEVREGGGVVIVTGFRATRGHPLTDAQKEANALVSRERAANEHGFAALKNWRILAKLRVNARRGTTLLRALLVLTRMETDR
jgi:hypothetical protein